MASSEFKCRRAARLRRVNSLTHLLVFSMRVGYEEFNNGRDAR
ncbi:uncharacterized protein J3R85_013872 [Psidium guajava]|nr:uncharacterized protein J3R85_013872 [Psidium guajava]